MTNEHWHQLYEAAVLELDAKRLKERIDAAIAAINERLKTLEPLIDHPAEHQMLTDAVQTLEALRRNELKPSA